MSLYVAGVPNELFLGSTALIAALVGGIHLRSVYFLFPSTASPVRNDSADMVVAGSRGIRLYATLLLIAAAFLIPRFKQPIPGPGSSASPVFTFSPYSETSWMIARAALVLTIAGASSAFERHPVFRILCCIAAPLSASVDALSELDYAAFLSCIVDGICTDPDGSITYSLRLYVARDLVSCTLALIIWLFCIPLSVVCGLFSNSVILYRKEYRDAMKRGL